MRPLRIARSAWSQHVPVGMFVVAALRPRVLVELGVHSGVSYCGFCQAVREFQLDTRCFGVDTWQGDAHSGLYGPEVLEELQAHHDPLYGEFSHLIQKTFDAALDDFDDGSIDLLHVDGHHAYTSVKHDFENWLPKMGQRGVVMFHDINVARADFGVWKLWQELQADYETFEFSHGPGLGMLAVSGWEEAFNAERNAIRA